MGKSGKNILAIDEDIEEDEEGSNNDKNESKATSSATTTTPSTYTYQGTSYAGATKNTTSTYGNASYTYPNYNYYYPAYQTSYTPACTFKSPHPNATTRVTFNVLIHNMALKEGDRMMVSGSPDALTAWGNGIEMECIVNNFNPYGNNNDDSYSSSTSHELDFTSTNAYGNSGGGR